MNGVDYFYEYTDEELVELMEDPWKVKMANLGQCYEGIGLFYWPLWKRPVGFALVQLLVYVTAQFQYITERTAHIVVTVLGLYLLYTQSAVMGHFFIPIICWALFYGTDQLMLGRSDRGNLSLILAIICLWFWQINLSSEGFMQVRGVLMIMCMKMVSLSYDDLNPTFFEHLALVFNPATVIFGPYISLDQFRRNMVRPNTTLKSLLLVLVYSAVAFGFCFYSTCLVELLPSEPEMLEDFKNAQAFRFSHFFVCYISLTTALMAGFSSSFQVAGALEVEWPKSMSEVVIHWNYPMHEFLHKYIFRRLVHTNYALAMLATFAMSSILHGLNFQLSAVLTSLAFYAYVETVFRQKLGNLLNVCATGKKCKKCTHQSDNTSVTAIAISLIFTMINVYHLIYLGMAFDGTEQETGYSYKHTISHWSRWNFSSHLIAVFMFFIGLL
ncbi:unnamed protein product [Bursaphelenchus okinawaensis]|uniref:Protein-serine O-palmitoleoyltransferase porcupine n=1 Tax=Bursaphelenchus okinawaensis TaxID=465554 RepID=A0A811LLM7_9BILA|nr:unnamed protein product [Bursaphelenchus okinawaensis]CAG9123700.1 unnamed protein product [Bursaphelenchus okinawaensis]